MTEQQLLDLFHQMTLEEKIGQLVQLDGGCFGTDAMVVGPREKLGITEETVRNCGSVLNVLGAEKVHEIQDHFLAENRLKIPPLHGRCNLRIPDCFPDSSWSWIHLEPEPDS